MCGGGRAGRGEDITAWSYGMKCEFLITTRSGHLLYKSRPLSLSPLTLYPAPSPKSIENAISDSMSSLEWNAMTIDFTLRCKQPELIGWNVGNIPYMPFLCTG